MKVRGKFHCRSVTTHARYDAESPVQRDFVFDAVDEAEWAKWTPSGKVEIAVLNDAIDWEPGKTYWLVVEPVEES